MKPMLCQKATLEEAREQIKISRCAVEHKYDGVRAYIENGKLFDRRQVEITARFPEFVGLNKLQDCMDGEIIAQSGEFNDISGRMHLKDKFLISLASKKSPAIFVVFDLPNEVGALEQRRKVLDSLVLPSWAQQSFHKQMTVQEFDELWSALCQQGREGVILKRLVSDYEFGKRSSEWKKVKAFIEIEATFTKYEEHPRGITLETSDGRRVVVNGAQADEVRETLKRTGAVRAEIQYLPQNNSDAWRFPSFRCEVKNK